MEKEVTNKIIIVGGGFGGVRAALDLAKNKLPSTKIILISDKPHFEYHASLYRVVTGRSPLEVCIPLSEIFKSKDVEVVEDTITEVDLKRRKLVGNSSSHYTFDYLVLALGSETSYFDLPGFKKYAFGFKSITDALALKRHMHEMFSSCILATDKEKECSLKFVIVGGGATGVELSGELAIYTKTLAKKHQLDPKLITIDLIQGSDRLLPSFSPQISQEVKLRLEELGVHVWLNKRVMKEDIETVYLKDMQMKTKTVIWTAGVVPNHLYKDIRGLTFDEKGKVIVDVFLHPVSSRPSPAMAGCVEGSRSTESDSGGSSTTPSTSSGSARNDNVENVFVIGDAAATPYSGMAQTAVHQGSYVVDSIVKKILGVEPLKYRPKKPFYAVPVGENWGLFLSNSINVYGIIASWFRRLTDLQFFLSILPFYKAIAAYRSDGVLWESCPICSTTD